MIYSAKDFGASCRTTAMLAALLLSGLSACGDGNSGATVKAPAASTAPAVNSKGLWIANGTNVLEYVPSQLAGGTSAAVPHLVNSSGAFGAPQGVTFDAHGNLWVMDPAGMVNGAATPALFEFSAAQLAALGERSNSCATLLLMGRPFR